MHIAADGFGPAATAVNPTFPSEIGPRFLKSCKVLDVPFNGVTFFSASGLENGDITLKLCTVYWVRAIAMYFQVQVSVDEVPVSVRNSHLKLFNNERIE